MSTTLPKQTSTAELMASIKALLSQVKQGYATALDSAIDAGIALKKAKKQLNHGKWLNFLREIKIGERSAQQYMQLASYRQELAEARKANGSALFPIGKALRVVKDLKEQERRQNGRPALKPAARSTSHRVNTSQSAHNDSDEITRNDSDDDSDPSPVADDSQEESEDSDIRVEQNVVKRLTCRTPDGNDLLREQFDQAVQRRFKSLGKSVATEMKAILGFTMQSLEKNGQVGDVREQDVGRALWSRLLGMLLEISKKSD